MSPLRCQPLLILITTSSELLFHHVPLCLMSDSSPRLWTFPNDFGRFRPFPTFVRIISFRCSTLLFGSRPFRAISATSVCFPIFCRIISVRCRTFLSGLRPFRPILETSIEFSKMNVNNRKARLHGYFFITICLYKPGKLLGWTKQINATVSDTLINPHLFCLVRLIFFFWASSASG